MPHCFFFIFLCCTFIINSQLVKYINWTFRMFFVDPTISFINLAPQETSHQSISFLFLKMCFPNELQKGRNRSAPSFAYLRQRFANSDKPLRQLDVNNSNALWNKKQTLLIFYGQCSRVNNCEIPKVLFFPM